MSFLALLFMEKYILMIKLRYDIDFPVYSPVYSAIKLTISQKIDLYFYSEIYVAVERIVGSRRRVRSSCNEVIDANINSRIEKDILNG